MRCGVHPHSPVRPQEGLGHSGTHTEGLKQLKDDVNGHDLVHQGDDFSAGGRGKKTFGALRHDCILRDLVTFLLLHQLPKILGIEVVTPCKPNAPSPEFLHFCGSS